MERDPIGKIEVWFIALLFVAVSHYSTNAASQEIVYATDFSDFRVGADRLVGTDGWEGDLQGIGDWRCLVTKC